MEQNEIEAILNSVHRINNKLSGVSGMLELVIERWNSYSEVRKQEMCKMALEASVAIADETFSIWNKIAKESKAYERSRVFRSGSSGNNQ